MIEVNLGVYKQTVEAALKRMAEQRVIQRIWSHDHTVWKPAPTEITNRLGWLRIAKTSKQNVDRLTGLADELRAAGYRRALLLGMGGSSLAPEVFARTFGPAEGYLDVSVIDSTDPELILSIAEELDYFTTLFIVSTKSGGTVETLSFFKYFYNRTVQAVGADRAGEHFLAITDPGSKLADLAGKYKFRDTFLSDPNIGGRYSALSYFGLVPSVEQSGPITVLGRISRRGSPHMRRILCQVALVVSARGSPHLRRWYEQVKKRRGTQKAIVALSRKILVIVWAMLRDNTQFQEPGQGQGKGQDDDRARRLEALYRHKLREMKERAQRSTRTVSVWDALHLLATNTKLRTELGLPRIRTTPTPKPTPRTPSHRQGCRPPSRARASHGAPG